MAQSDDSVRPSNRARPLKIILSILFAYAGSFGVSDAAAAGGYTPAQAARGASIFAANCASCHAQNLTGGAGPALAGPAFHTSIQANYKTAARLNDFISKQMPLNAPGSLKGEVKVPRAFTHRQRGDAFRPLESGDLMGLSASPLWAPNAIRQLDCVGRGTKVGRDLTAG